MGYVDETRDGYTKEKTWKNCLIFCLISYGLYGIRKENRKRHGKKWKNPSRRTGLKRTGRKLNGMIGILLCSWCLRCWYGISVIISGTPEKKVNAAALHNQIIKKKEKILPAYRETIFKKCAREWKVAKIDGKTEKKVSDKRRLK